MPLELAIAQFIAYVTLTLTGITVAVVSLRFSYRQNFGWKPLVFVPGHGMRGGGDTPELYHIVLPVEFWNRRTYPLVLRSIMVEFSDMKFETSKVSHSPDRLWYIHTHGKASYRGGDTVAGKEHLQLELDAPFAKRSLDDFATEISVKAIFYDPRTNKTDTVKTSYSMDFRS
ncbi:hypothetical protein [Henriciella sp.]|uniref:hypothetical protein n=1 Tax=Henriciella sp. TaxID=1968823 RepID=UPI00262F810D|nr:hypothetical protein [Henriciella sp.]